MSKIQIKAFFKFCRVKIMEQVVDILEKTVKINVKPDERKDLKYRHGRLLKNFFNSLPFYILSIVNIYVLYLLFRYDDFMPCKF